MEKYGLLTLRLFAGLTMIVAHGMPKFTNFATYVQRFPDPIGMGAHVSLSLAIFAEVICAAFLVLGLFTRMALIPLIITMAVAFFVVHSVDPFAKKELAFMYLGCYAALFFTGPGELSLQHMFRISAGRFGWLLK